MIETPGERLARFLALPRKRAKTLRLQSTSRPAGKVKPVW